MRIAICDDEVSMVQILEEKIKKLLPDAVIEKYLSGDELIASGSKLLPAHGTQDCRSHTARPAE